MIHRWTAKTTSVGALLFFFCALGSGLGQTQPEPHTFFEQSICLLYTSNWVPQRLLLIPGLPASMPSARSWGPLLDSTTV